ncbi:ABC transporter permease [Ruminiclostridium cellobioparum]|uniref:ABC-type polysaccharide transport system, permease component n=1 Tax=Ruminiclostridium cellobioparum subsp. termitidis CT1112 TaxID=1195236 RepID=S0FGU4_RUMCE|nr:ABC transporter permease subunit [Ruminiclostridium cellobioparum]EMS68986.1 ABC-type polysaccharide transport system, permease component [Ruminiclostridium cellobioparum subsp. termitidis CT1112]
MSILKNLKRDIIKNKYIYLMAIPVAAFYICFCYLPMGGLVIAFQDYAPAKGILGSEWVGFQNFINFFHDYQFTRLLRNTILLSLKLIIFGFPAPILLALLINELRWKRYRKTVQTLSYLPHFISLVVVCGLISDFTSSTGLVNQLLSYIGIEPKTFLMQPKMFQPLFVTTDIWQTIGWGSIVYLSAISSIDPGLYEAATIDGAGRFRQILSVTIPSLMSTIIVLFIMRIGNIMSLGYEKVILLYNPTIMERADIISSFTYRRGLLDMDYGFSTAVGMFNSVINFVILWIANRLCKKFTGESLW